MTKRPPQTDSSRRASSPRIAGEASLDDVRPVTVAPTDHDLTIVIPALNEEQRLPWTLNELAALLKDWPVNSRVVVVDDGSSDGTAGLTDGFGPHFSTIRLPQQQGKGNAVRTAMLRVTGRVLAFTDADLPFDLGALWTGFEWIRSGQCQVVFGARDIEQSANIAPRRLARRIATCMFREVVSRLVSREVTDTQCGLKLFSRRAALELFSRTTIDGFAFDAEVVLLTHLLKLPFRRIPVTLVNEYGSTISLRRHALPMLLEVLRTWLRARRGEYSLEPRFAGQSFEPLPEGEQTRWAA
jgi:dolichyl-phosphate beta-glucosyltransferase